MERKCGLCERAAEEICFTCGKSICVMCVDWGFLSQDEGNKTTCEECSKKEKAAR